LFSIVQTLGWPIWPLIIASVVALALVIERSIALRRSRVLPPNLLNDVLTLYSRRQITLDVLEKLQSSSGLGFVFAAACAAPARRANRPSRRWRWPAAT